MEKLPLRKITVSNPSRKIAKKTIRNTPQPPPVVVIFTSAASLAVCPSCFDSQKITYQIRAAVINIEVASKRASMEVLPIEVLMRTNTSATNMLATIAHPTLFNFSIETLLV